MKYLFLLLILGSLGACYNNNDKKPEDFAASLKGSDLPSFSLLMPDSITRLDTRQIPSGEPVMLCYFGTHCPYSRAEMSDIIAHIDEFKNVRLYIFTTDPFNSMKDFYADFQLNKYPNITMGVDVSKYFGGYFKTPGVPYVAVYGKDKKLIKVHIGRTKAEKIKTTTEG